MNAFIRRDITTRTITKSHSHISHDIKTASIILYWTLMGPRYCQDIDIRPIMMSLLSDRGSFQWINRSCGMGAHCCISFLVGLGSEEVISNSWALGHDPWAFSKWYLCFAMTYYAVPKWIPLLEAAVIYSFCSAILFEWVVSRQRYHESQDPIFSEW